MCVSNRLHISYSCLIWHKGTMEWTSHAARNLSYLEKGIIERIFISTRLLLPLLLLLFVVALVLAAPLLPLLQIAVIVAAAAVTTLTSSFASTTLLSTTPAGRPAIPHIIIMLPVIHSHTAIGPAPDVSQADCEQLFFSLKRVYDVTHT